MADSLSADLRVYSDLGHLIRKAAEEVVRLANAAVSRNGRCSLALAGGRTPRTLYELFAREYVEKIPWTQVHIFWGDERYVPAEDPRSNYRMVREALLDHVPIPPENVHPMPTEYPQPEVAAAAYESVLGNYFSRPWPRFDLVLLGIGADGHTASLFPGSPVLAERERWVVAAQAPADPPRRLTLTFPVLNQAAQVHFLVAGAEKAEAVRCVLSKPSKPANCPAGAVHPVNGVLVWWIDQEAARLLEPRVGVPA